MAIVCQGQRLQNFTEARLNIPEIAKERQCSLVLFYILAIRCSFFGRFGERREMKGVLSGETTVKQC